MVGTVQGRCARHPPRLRKRGLRRESGTGNGGTNGELSDREMEELSKQAPAPAPAATDGLDRGKDEVKQKTQEMHSFRF